MKNVTSKPELSHPSIESNSHLFDDWFDPIEDMIRGQVRGLIEEMIRGELDATLARPRYGRRAGHSEGRDSAAIVTGHRHGSRVRTLTGTFGKTEIAVPRARLNDSDGKTTEWKSQVLRNYQRRTRAADALIASTYLAGTNTRRVRRALRSVFGGEVCKDTSSFLPVALLADAGFRYLAAPIPFAAALTTLRRRPPSSRDNLDSSDSISCRRAATLACKAVSTSRFRTFNLDSVIVFKDSI